MIDRRVEEREPNDPTPNMVEVKLQLSPDERNLLQAEAMALDEQIVVVQEPDYHAISVGGICLAGEFPPRLQSAFRYPYRRLNAELQTHLHDAERAVSTSLDLTFIDELVTPLSVSSMTDQEDEGAEHFFGMKFVGKEINQLIRCAEVCLALEGAVRDVSESRKDRNLRDASLSNLDFLPSFNSLADPRNNLSLETIARRIIDQLAHRAETYREVRQYVVDRPIPGQSGVSRAVFTTDATKGEPKQYTIALSAPYELSVGGNYRYPTQQVRQRVVYSCSSPDKPPVSAYAAIKLISPDLSVAELKRFAAMQTKAVDAAAICQRALGYFMQPVETSV